MGKTKKLFTFVEVDDSTPIQKLSVSDQLRVLIKKFSYDAANDLKNEDAVTRERLTLKATCMDFLRRATEPIREGKHKSVTVNVSSTFLPVLDSVLKDPEIQRFYRVEVARPKVDDTVHFDFLVRLTVKTQ